METIKGHCTTNLDDYDCSKVREFYRVPNKDERISVTRKGYDSTLRVCQITHSVRDNKPYIIVELHK